MSTVTTKSEKNTVKSALAQKQDLQKKIAELQARIAESKKLEAELAETTKEVNEAARVELEGKLNAFAEKMGMSLADLGRCMVSLAKNGHLKGDSNQSLGGPRKERIVLTDEQKAAVISELRTMQSAKDAIISHCKEVASRSGMPGFQTIYNWATEANVQGKVVAAK